MKPETAGKIKYGGWGLACGAVIAMIIGFGWGGWTTAATTQKVAEEAVLASQSAICVAQFIQQPDREEKLAELKKIGNWKRAEYIEKGGWDKSRVSPRPHSIRPPIRSRCRSFSGAHRLFLAVAGALAGTATARRDPHHPASGYHVRGQPGLYSPQSPGRRDNPGSHPRAGPGAIFQTAGGP